MASAAFAPFLLFGDRAAWYSERWRQVIAIFALIGLLLVIRHRETSTSWCREKSN
jgi:hypothetical protein